MTSEPVLNYDAATSLGLKGATVDRNFPIINGLCPTVPANSCTAAGGMYAMGPPSQGHSYWEKPATTSNLTWIKGSQLRLHQGQQAAEHPAIETLLSQRFFELDI